MLFRVIYWCVGWILFMYNGWRQVTVKMHVFCWIVEECNFVYVIFWIVEECTLVLLPTDEYRWVFYRSVKWRQVHSVPILRRMLAWVTLTSRTIRSAQSSKWLCVERRTKQLSPRCHSSQQHTTSLPSRHSSRRWSTNFVATLRQSPHQLTHTREFVKPSTCLALTICG